MRKSIILSIILSVFLVACRSVTTTNGTTAATTMSGTKETTAKVSTETSVIAPTEKTTQAPTQISTQISKQISTQISTQITTQVTTQDPTQAPTQAPTVAPTEVQTEVTSKTAQASTPVYDSSNPFNNQDDKEVPYDPSRWIQPGYWNSPKINPKDYKGGIMLYFDKIGLEPEYCRGKVQRVYFSLTGATESISQIKFHVFYDARLSVVRNSNGDVITPGRLLNGFTTGSSMTENGQLVFYGVSDNDVLLDKGCIFTIDFLIPENAQSGDLYPFGLAYVVDDVAADTFSTLNPDDACRLQMAYVFTRGIYNGYIKMK